MLKNILWGMLISSQIASVTFGCDQDELNSKVISISGNLHDHKSVTKSEIKDNLGFVYDETEIKGRYKTPDSFLSLLEQETRAISNNECFSDFANICKQIYEEGTIGQKSAVHMLFEKVSSKVQDYSVSQQRRLKLPSLSPETLKQQVQDFMNMDRADIPHSGSVNTHSDGSPIVTH